MNRHSDLPATKPFLLVLQILFKHKGEILYEKLILKPTGTLDLTQHSETQFG